MGLQRMRRIGELVIGIAVMLHSAQAEDHIWLIGGGADLESSQAQIELNVIWARDVFTHLPGQRQIHVYFNDGSAPAKDVKEWRPPPETASSLQPLARVFDSDWSNGESYRNHRVPGVLGGTEAKFLQEHLGKAFQQLHAGDRVLLVFNGHGSHDRKDPNGNTIDLWGPSALTVKQVDALLSQIPRQVSLRFVFTQCYSGAFVGLSHPDSSRCGFVAEAEDEPAEGCSASVEAGDYRDYSTYFFAALAGRTRDGGPLKGSPDRNGDGQVSLYEAHLYTLRVGRSSDLPRSTSEVYLERWLPWYLSWAPWALDLEADNVYSSLADTLAEAEGLTPGSDLGEQLALQRRRLAQDRERLEREQARLRKQMSVLRMSIEDAVLARWPEARHPYTLNFRRFLEQDLDAAQTSILSHPNYPALVQEQDHYWQVEDELLENERTLTQLEKIERLAWLGDVFALFQHLASKREREAYQRLLTCEQQGL
jgi:hypothetical protein